MNAMEIILLIIGFIAVSVSFFVGGRETEPDAKNSDDEQKSRDIWTEKEAEIVKEQIDAILNEETEEIVAEAAETLNRKSNEKIMEFDEFSSQIVEKIKHNHEEVVFMYNMLNEKQKELKEDMTRLVAKEPVATEGKEELPIQKKSPEKIPADSMPGAKPPAVKAVETERAAESPSDRKADEVAEKTVKRAAQGANQEIIKMYRKGKSVLQISKELGIGQGEVKLMIALYGGKG